MAFSLHSSEYRVHPLNRNITLLFRLYTGHSTCHCVNIFPLHSCPFLVEHLTVFIPVIGGVLFVFVIISLLRTSFTDPGILPRATPDEAADIEKQIGKVQHGSHLAFCCGTDGPKKLGHMGDSRILTVELSILPSNMVEEQSGYLCCCIHILLECLECVF